MLNKKNLTITEVSNETGIARSTLTPIVNTPEKVKSIRFDTMDKLCNYLNIKLSELIEYKPDNDKITIKKVFPSLNKRFGVFLLKRETTYKDEYGYLSFLIEKHHEEAGKYLVTLEIMNEKELEILNKNLSMHNLTKLNKDVDQNQLRDVLKDLDRESLATLSIKISSFFVSSDYYEPIENIELYWGLGHIMFGRFQNTFTFEYDKDNEVFKDISEINDLEHEKHRNHNILRWNLIDSEKLLD